MRTREKFIKLFLPLKFIPGHFPDSHRAEPDSMGTGPPFWASL